MHSLKYLMTAFIGLFSLSGQAEAAEPKATGKAIFFFEKNIRPVLVKHCYECHSTKAKQVQGGLWLDTRDGTRKGGETGPAVVPGNMKKSLIIDALEHTSLEMPPDKKLPANVIANFRRWIRTGAADPRLGKSPIAGKKPKAVRQTLWSLKPITLPKLPRVNNTAWPRNEIDRFILARLEKAGLKPVGDADRLTLLRRVTFDLVGLPPTPQEIEAFQNDRSANAFEKVVDRLLESTHFGERWGRHWLDIARFAESNGKDRDALYPTAWRYRRFVIDSFNADKPYDQFLTEQLAGDLLPAKDEAHKNKLLIATGFLAIGPKNLMQRGEQMLAETVDEQIDVTTRSILALTVSCARCHDHKFDPIPSRDYYALAGIFRSTETLYGSGTRGGKNKATHEKNLQPLKTPKASTPQAIAARKKQLTALKMRRDAATKLVTGLQKLLRQAGRDKKRSAVKRRALNQAHARLKMLETQYKNALAGKGTSTEFAMAVREAKKIADAKINLRGDYRKLGAQVPRGFLSAIKSHSSISVNQSQSGRLELARWMTDSANPLTTRVAVNRVWHHLLGRGLVRTVDNFGLNGEEPSHPELLDYLAMEFSREGWSFKKIIRKVVLCRTYQLANTGDDHAMSVDPDNTLIWRMSQRRLDAESLRDAILSASGKLNHTPPVRSPVAEVGYGEVGRGINTKPLEREFLHRSVYLPVIRGLLPEIFKVFDFAEPSIVVGSRTSTNVPTQALFFMNSDFIIGNSEALAKRLLAETKQLDTKKIDVAYRRTLSRPATEGEISRATAYLKSADERLRSRQPDSAKRRQIIWTSFCQALFASAEFRYRR
jgi:hypothetical protein